MTETIRYSRVYLEDLDIGAGTGQVVLADGRVVSLSQVNLDLISDQLSRVSALLPYKVMGTRWYGLAGYKTLDDALAAIGTDTRTLIVTTPTDISINTTIPTNVTLHVTGEGSFAVAASVTLTLSGPLEASFRQIFSGDGTVRFTYNVEVYSEWWGGIGDGATDSTEAIQAAINSGPSQGVVLRGLAGTYNFNDTLTRTVPLQILGAGIDVTTFQMTTSASLQHGISGTTTLICRDFTLKMQTALTTNSQMSGIRMDLDGTGLTGRQIHIENVKVRGFNIAIYCDGGTSYGIDRGIYRNIDVQASGDGTSYIGSALHMNRVTQGEISLATVDQNTTGEHAIYCFGMRDAYLADIRIRNATKSESQAIKLVGDGVTSTGVFGTWSVRNVDAENCTNGILVQIFGTELLGSAHIENVKCKTITGSATVTGCVHVEATGTSTINSILCNNLYIENTGYQGLHCAAAAGATIGRIEFANVWAKNWSTVSTGTYTLFGSNGVGTFNHIHLRNIYADGNSNGRTIVGVAGMSTTVSRVTWEHLIEVNTTAVGRPVSFTDADTTPSVKLGNHFYVNNTGATTVTALDDMQADETYFLYHANGNTTYDNGASFVSPEAVDITPASGQVMVIYTHDGTVAYEVNSNRT